MKQLFLASIATLSVGIGLALAGEPPAAAQETTAPWVAPTPIVTGAPVSAMDESQDTTRVWAHADYLLWWLKNSPVPAPLLTSAGPPSSTGIIGQPGTQILLGGSNVSTQEHSGGNFRIGTWIDSDNTLGVEGRYFFLGQKSTTQTVISPTGAAPLAIPFLIPSVTPPSQQAVRFTNPFGPQIGTLTIRQSLQDAEFNGLMNVASGSNLRLDLIGGFRFLEFDEDLAFGFSAVFPPPAPPNVIEATSFRTQNQFYGGQLGARGEYWMGKLFVNGTCLLALGDMHEVLNANQVTFGFIPPAQGRLTRDRLAYIPEGSINVGYQLTSWARVSAGYNILVANEMARAGGSASEPILTPASHGIVFPPPQLTSGSFWAQGLNLGLEIRY